MRTDLHSYPWIFDVLELSSIYKEHVTILRRVLCSGVFRRDRRPPDYHGKKTNALSIPVDRAPKGN